MMINNVFLLYARKIYWLVGGLCTMTKNQAPQNPTYSKLDSDIQGLSKSIYELSEFFFYHLYNF
jgi:hypothetical protein